MYFIENFVKTQVAVTTQGLFLVWGTSPVFCFIDLYICFFRNFLFVCFSSTIQFLILLLCSIISNQVSVILFILFRIAQVICCPLCFYLNGRIEFYGAMMTIVKLCYKDYIGFVDNFCYFYNINSAKLSAWKDFHLLMSSSLFFFNVILFSLQRHFISFIRFLPGILFLIFLNNSFCFFYYNTVT